MTHRIAIGVAVLVFATLAALLILLGIGVLTGGVGLNMIEITLVTLIGLASAITVDQRLGAQVHPR